MASDLKNSLIKTSSLETIGNVGVSGEYGNLQDPAAKWSPARQPDRGEADQDDDSESLDILYEIDESPPIYMAILLGLQHYLAMFFATLTVPFLLSKAICIGEDNVAKAELIGTLFTASGLITLLQTFLGCRLPIVQAGTFALLAPTLSYFSLEQWECPSNIITQDQFDNLTLSASNDSWIIMGSPEHQEVWRVRLREIQGAIMMAALIEVVLGATGAVGVLLRFIGPLTICPMITLLGLQMFENAAIYGAKHWWICILTMLLMVIFSQYLGRFSIPCFSYSKEKGVHAKSYPLFKMFPIMLAMSISWLICFILTATSVFPDDPDKWGYWARTDIRLDALKGSPWFRVPYPGQWGMPTLSVAAVFAIMSGILATTIESVGDYHSCAKLVGAPPPPLHAVNRGIFIEGLGSFLDGMFGTGNGTTSTSINVGVVGITKVGSRCVVQYSAVFMIVLGIFTKFGALFVTIPEPVIGASFFILFGMIMAVGLSNLQHVNFNSGRNLFIIGFSLFNGLAIPQWVKTNPGAIKTGNETVDNILVVLLSTSMFMGGVIGFALDNTIPGTKQERGLAQWQNARDAVKTQATSPAYRKKLARAYDLPFGMKFIRRQRWLRYFPLSPTFGVPLSILKEMELQDQDSEKEEEESIVPDNNTKV